MRSGNQELTFASAPVQTQRAHYSTKFGDGKRSIIHTSKMAVGPDHVKAQDFNIQLVVILGVFIAIGAHWATLGRNGWTHWVDGHGKLRKLTFAERRRTIQWFIDTHGANLDALHSLRRGHTGESPLTWAEAIEIAMEHGVVLTPELKSQSFRFASGGQAITEPCRRLNYPCWAMALYNMKFAREKCAQIIANHGHFALIFGKFRNQARGTNKVRNWAIKPSIIWGPKSARQWLRA